jgi:hypothetical protein
MYVCIPKGINIHNVALTNLFAAVPSIMPVMICCKQMLSALCMCVCMFICMYECILECINIHNVAFTNLVAPVDVCICVCMYICVRI